MESDFVKKIINYYVKMAPSIFRGFLRIIGYSLLVFVFIKIVNELLYIFYNAQIKGTDYLNSGEYNLFEQFLGTCVFFGIGIIVASIFSKEYRKFFLNLFK